MCLFLGKGLLGRWSVRLVGVVRRDGDEMGGWMAYLKSVSSTGLSCEAGSPGMDFSLKPGPT